MKANRKFRDGEEAVSAVIGVILMVAITVAIAATVYVYVSGMLPAGGTSVPSITLVQDAATAGGWVNFTVDSASQDAKWSDLKVMIGTDDIGTPTETKTPADGACGYNGSGTPIKANGKLYINDSTSVVAGAEVAIIHIPSNSRVIVKTIY
jgi:flagellin-like protein